jgi:glucosamine-6-phosphate deaminase
VRIVDRTTVADVAIYVADRIVRAVDSGVTVLGVATGASPIPTYVELARRSALGEIDLRHCHLVLLDEYIGIPQDDPLSFRSTIMRQVAEPLGIPPTRVHGPDGTADDLDAACDRFEQRITELGGVGLQVLGIGRNGHIGFNEPGTPRELCARVAELSATTLADNAAVFAGSDTPVPTRAITQGIATISSADAIVLIATGATKANAIRRLSRGEDSLDLPASALLHHRDTTVLIDADCRAAMV